MSFLSSFVGAYLDLSILERISHEILISNVNALLEHCYPGTE